MSTLNDLIASVHTALHSYTGVQEQMTYLIDDVDDVVTTLLVGSTETMLRGIAEIDDELLYVDATDSGGVQLPPFGRGFRNTIPAPHAANAPVLFDPVFPRIEIRRAIESVVEGLFPYLYQIKTFNIEYMPGQLGFELPLDCDGIVMVKESAPWFGYHEPIARWTYDPNSPFESTKALNLFDPIRAGADIQVVYRAKFGRFEFNDSTLASVGLDENHADLILYGVTARMIRFLDPARLQVRTVENLSRANVVQAGDASKIANQLYTVYQQRLAEERRRLLELHPPSIQFTR